MIICQRLRPGVRLVERDLAEQLSVNRTPIRAAIKRLEEEGIVKTIEGVGAFVREIQPMELIDLVQAWAVIEGGVARLAAPKITDKELAELEELAEPLDQRHFADEDEATSVRLQEMDVKFHRLVARASRNPHLIDLMHRTEAWRAQARPVLKALAQRFGQSTKTDPMFTHAPYIAALRSHDPDRTEQVARSHVLLAKVEWLEQALREHDVLRGSSSTGSD